MQNINITNDILKLIITILISIISIINILHKSSIYKMFYNCEKYIVYVIA